MQAAAYIRVSTEEQTEFSPDAQLRAIRKYCKDKSITLPQEYIFKDEGISARTAEARPAFMRMIALAKASPKPFDIILVHRFDRFSRNREDSVVYKSLLRKQCGIKVVSITEQMQDDKFSIILESMLEAMAEYYSLNLSDEVKKGMTEKALRGELQTPAPFGYRMDNGLLLPDEDTGAVAADIFALAAAGFHTPQSIADHLTDRGFQTKRGNPFSARAVRYILQNPLYKGYIRWTTNKKNRTRQKGEKPEQIVVRGNHPPLVSEALWQQANDVLIHPTPARRPVADSARLFNGLLYCAACGSPLYLCGKSSAPIYRCGGYLNRACPKSQGISARRMELLALTELQNHYKSEMDSYHLNIIYILLKALETDAPNPPKDTAQTEQAQRQLHSQIHKITFNKENTQIQISYQ